MHILVQQIRKLRQVLYDQAMAEAGRGDLRDLADQQQQRAAISLDPRAEDLWRTHGLDDARAAKVARRQVPTRVAFVTVAGAAGPKAWADRLRCSIEREAKAHARKKDASGKSPRGDKRREKRNATRGQKTFEDNGSARQRYPAMSQGTATSTITSR